MFLEAFDRLSEREKHEVATEILRRTLHADLPRMDDEALTEIAAKTLEELDAREAGS
jgi:hypothetical protein